MVLAKVSTSMQSKKGPDDVLAKRIVHDAGTIGDKDVLLKSDQELALVSLGEHLKHRGTTTWRSRIRQCERAGAMEQ